MSVEFHGTLLVPGDELFEDARVGRVFNGRRPDRQPAAILLAADEADVQAGVRLAREKGWQVSVRSGGHSWAAWSVRDNALLIDLERLCDMALDDASGVVAAGPAVKGGDELDPFLAERGRFFNGGHCPSVGIGGFLLQGGQGWNARGWGWAAESIVALDVVTADGDLIRVDHDHHADLFWAARGCGPSFPGIVTRFHLQTRERFGYVGHTVHIYPLSEFDAVMAWMYSIHASISPDVEIVVVSTCPPGDVPGSVGERVLAVTGVALVETAAQAAAALAPFQTCPVLDKAVFRMDAAESSLAVQRIEQERANPPHARYVVDNAWVSGPVEDVLDGIRPLFTDLPTVGAFTIWFSMAPLRELPDMAFSMQSDAYVASYVVYDDAESDAAQREWLNAAMRRAQPVTVGQYLGDGDMTNRQVAFMGSEQWGRFTEIREQYDPDNLFVSHLCKDNETLNRNEWDTNR